MSGNRFLIDTNIVLYVLNGNEELATFLNGEELWISVITEMELLSYPAISESEIKKLKAFLSQISVKQLDEQVKNKAIEIRRTHRIKLPDSIIIATALIHEIPLVTADKQLRNIEDIQLILYQVS